MCRFKSGIILKNKVVVAPGENDSHSDLLESLGIKDDYFGATNVFVRAELVPVNDEWWIDPAEEPDKWRFVVDQDMRPEWFDESEHEKIFLEAVCGWWKEHVLVDQKLEELSSGYYLLKRCEVKKLLNDVKVLLDSSQVGKMWDSSQVGKMRGSSQVGEMWDSSQVGTMWGSSQVDEMRGSSQVGTMRDRSTARDFKNWPRVKIWVSPEGTFEMVAHQNKSEE